MNQPTIPPSSPQAGTNNLWRNLIKALGLISPNSLNQSDPQLHLCVKEGVIPILSWRRIQSQSLTQWLIKQLMSFVLTKVPEYFVPNHQQSDSKIHSPSDQNLAIRQITFSQTRWNPWKILQITNKVWSINLAISSIRPLKRVQMS
jgi:hypothetical protein